MTLFERLAELPLSIERHEFVGLSEHFPPNFERLTTEVHLHGKGECGKGEDVTYSSREQRAHRELSLALAGEWSVSSFSEHLERLDLYPEAPEHEVNLNYRRWAYESAALDLALRQAGLSLPKCLERTASPFEFVVSMRADRSSLPRLKTLSEIASNLHFKLDLTDAFDEEFVQSLARLDRVATVDLKGAYVGTVVDTPADSAVYGRVLKGLPDCLLEDPGLTADSEELFAGAWHRVSWDVPIHSVADVEALVHAPGAINVKPSRSGSLRNLCSLYEYLNARNIPMYGGGQFELGVGRRQIQLLASLFHPHAPNDVAPGRFNHWPMREAPLAGPLGPRPCGTGFDRELD